MDTLGTSDETELFRFANSPREIIHRIPPRAGLVQPGKDISSTHREKSVRKGVELGSINVNNTLIDCKK